jgi:hypothetical protein
MLENLSRVNKYDSRANKIETIFGKDNSCNVTSSIPMLSFDGGVPKYILTNSQEQTLTKKDAIKQLNNLNKNYFYYNTIDKYLDKSKDLDLKDANDKGVKNINSYKKETKQKSNEFDKLYKNLVDIKTGEVFDYHTYDFYNEKSKDISLPRLSSGNNTVEVFERDPLRMTSSGWKENSKESLALGVANRRRESSSTYISQDPNLKLNILKTELDSSGIKMDDFEKFCIAESLNYIKENSENSSDYNARLLQLGLTEEDVNNSNVIERFKMDNPKAYIAYKNYINSIDNLAKDVKAITGEVFDPIVVALAPYKPKDNKNSNAMAVEAIKSLTRLDRFNPLSSEGAVTFDFFRASKTIIQELSSQYGLRYMAEELKESKLISNDTLIDKTLKIIDSVVFDSKTENTKYISEDEVAIKNIVTSTISSLVKFNVDGFFNSKIPLTESYKNILTTLNTELPMLITRFNEEYGLERKINSFSDFNELINNSADSQIKKDAQVIYNYYCSKVLIGQALIEKSKELQNNLSNYIDSLSTTGYSLVNKFGQKYEMGGVVKPITPSSTGFLLDNIEITANSTNKTKWTQFIFEKILSGDIYLLRNDIADTLDKDVYTSKVGNRTMQTLKNVSKWSAALQMALPSKIINRVISFTGFDYSMALAYDWRSAKYFGQARKEILAAYQTKGKNLKQGDPLYEYFIREGQPIGLTGKDPVTFQEDLSGPENVMKILNTMTDPLEIQNHLGRYALYLTALEGFNKQSEGKGNANYGPVYYNKEAIDALRTNEDKAMYVMDYMLGAPGGFPKLSKDLSGLMLYATFPMNLTRTCGAYAMSLGKLAKDTFAGTGKANNWATSALMPSLGLAGITFLSTLLSALICDLYDVDEEERKRYIDKKMTIDPVGTLLGETPTFSSSSMNPLNSIEEMFITPYTDSNNDNIFKKIFGYLNANVMSHLNPLLKTPLEIGTNYDYYGSSPVSTKEYYTRTENAIRKVLGFFIGSNSVNNIIQQFKIDKYNTDDVSLLSSLTTGFGRGLSESIGNQKQFKKDTSNYYNQIYKINSYYYLNEKHNTYDKNLQDLITANYYNLNNSSYNKEDYERINKLMKAMINKRETPDTVYNLILEEYNNGVGSGTLKSVLNNNSIVRKLAQLKNPDAYIESLDSDKRKDLTEAIEYEEAMYPMLDEFFTNKSTSNRYSRFITKEKYQPSVPRYYYGSSYYNPGKYAPYWNPNTYSSYKKYKSYKPYDHIDKTDVKVSKEMGVWSKDYNQMQDLKSPLTYLDNPYYNNLSDYEKNKKKRGYK